MSTAASSGSAVEEARVDSMVEYIRYSVLKSKALPTVATQLLLLALIAAVVLTQPISRELFDFQEEQLMRPAQASAVATPREAIVWVTDVVNSFYALRVQNDTRSTDGNVPIAMLTIRGEKSVTNDWISECKLPEQLSLLQSSHYQDLVDACKKRSSSGAFFSFPLTDWESAGFNHTAVLEQVANSTELDDDASFVLRVFLYSSNVDKFVDVTATYAADESRIILRKQPFWYHRIGEGVTDTFELVSWGIVVLCCLHIAYRSVHITRLRIRVLRQTWLDSVGAQQLFDIIFLVFVGITIGFYGTTLVSSLDVTKHQTDHELYDMLVEYVDSFHLYGRFLAWSALLASLRCLFFFRLFSRFAVVNETITSSVPSLFGCTLIFFVVVTAYALTGRILYGKDIFEMRSFEESFKFLMILVFREGSLNYTPFSRSAPNSTPVFFVSFAFFAQIVVLNIVVGVLASSFSAAVATMELVRLPNWSWHALVDDTRRFFLRYFFLTEPSPDHPQALVYLSERLDLLGALLDSGLPPTHLISAAKLAQMAPLVDMSTCSEVVKKARHHVGTSDAVARQSKTAVQAMLRFERMEGQLWRQSKMVQEVHAAFIGAEANTEILGDRDGSEDDEEVVKPGERLQVKLGQLSQRARSMVDAAHLSKKGLEHTEERLTMLEATVEMLHSMVEKREQAAKGIPAGEGSDASPQ